MLCWWSITKKVHIIWVLAEYMYLQNSDGEKDLAKLRKCHSASYKPTAVKSRFIFPFFFLWYWDWGSDPETMFLCLLAVLILPDEDLRGIGERRGRNPILPA